MLKRIFFLKNGEFCDENEVKKYDRKEKIAYYCIKRGLLKPEINSNSSKDSTPLMSSIPSNLDLRNVSA